MSLDMLDFIAFEGFAPGSLGNDAPGLFSTRDVPKEPYGGSHRSMPYDRFADDLSTATDADRLRAHFKILRSPIMRDAEVTPAQFARGAIRLAGNCASTVPTVKKGALYER